MKAGSGPGARTNSPRVTPTAGPESTQPRGKLLMVISAADTKAILRILSEALPDDGGDLVTSVEIDEDPENGQLEVKLKTRDYAAISALREGSNGIEFQILRRRTARTCSSVSGKSGGRLNGERVPKRRVGERLTQYTQSPQPGRE